MALWHFGFAADNVTGNGASENRSAFKTIPNTSAEKLIGHHFTEKQNKLLPMKQNIAFYHPAFIHENKKIVIFIGGEMPHLIKKIVNAPKSCDNTKSKQTWFLE
eukprot:5134540-Ditylum_brightwellii.AAC.2